MHWSVQTIPFESVISIQQGGKACSQHHNVSINLKASGRCIRSRPITFISIKDAEKFVRVANEMKLTAAKEKYPSLESLLGETVSFPQNWKLQEKGN